MTRATTSTSSIPESQSSGKKEERDQPDEKEVQRRLGSLADTAGPEESSLGDRVGPTVASSAYLTRVPAGSLDDKGGLALHSRKDVEDKVSHICLQPASC